MKKFLFEYKAVRAKSDTETSKERDNVDPSQDMGVFKWLRRERVSVTSQYESPIEVPEENAQNTTQVATLRTEEYKRDLAEFQARRSSGNKELPDTPVKKKCGRHSLPISCTDCATDHDNTFNYEKKSGIKYKKRTHKRTRSATPHNFDGLPSIQFLFQNQVFMPGNLIATSYSEPRRTKHRQKCKQPTQENAVKQIDFEEDLKSPPLFYKNNNLPFDSKEFLKACKSEEEEVDGVQSKKDSSSSSDVKETEDKLWEVMSELKNFDQWADEQLQSHNTSVSKSDDSKSDASANGLPLASACNLDVSLDKTKVWNRGRWGVVPVQTKRLGRVSVDDIAKNANLEVNILRKCRHPNIILLMGLYPDGYSNVHIICERCIDSLFGTLHVQGRILSVQTSVQYALDVANALVFLRMQGYIHTDLTSFSIMLTAHGAAKLADLGPCVKVAKQKNKKKKPEYSVYSPEPQYVNIEDVRRTNSPESEPLLSKHPSETYLLTNSVGKSYNAYRDSEHYHWQAPELFEPDEAGLVYPCAKSDVYSLCVVLWECCNAKIPWKTQSYEQLKEAYSSWETGIRLPQNGTYPGCLLALLQSGLKLQRNERMDLEMLQKTLQDVKRDLDQMEYIIIPAQLNKKKSNFSSVAWDTSPTDESDYPSPVTKHIQHKAVIHKPGDTSSESDKDAKSDASPLYETIRKQNCNGTYAVAEKCFLSDDDSERNHELLKYEHLPERETSSACSTPIAKIRARIKDIGTPGTLHRSDSTEYCSLMSPDFRMKMLNESVERPTAKLSRSFTPKSYRPLHIKVPEYNLDSVKTILKERKTDERSSYNFDIKNYSLPTTPIARSNKLRRNAWLSGELNLADRCPQIKTSPSIAKKECIKPQSAPETPTVVSNSSLEKEDDEIYSKQLFIEEESSFSTEDVRRDSYTGLKKIDAPPDFSPETDDNRERTNSWSFRTSVDRPSVKYKIEEDALANVNVKPLVAIHERWIYEANKKIGRSMSLPEDNRTQNIPAVKPASHCVDTLLKSLPQMNLKHSIPKPFRTHPVSPTNGSKNGSHWEQFCQAREAVAKGINFAARDPDKCHTWKKETEKGTSMDDPPPPPPRQPKVDRATDTRSIEEFIKDLIHKEFQHLVTELSDTTEAKNEEILNKGVANIMENLKSNETEPKKTQSFSRVKINGNNKPLLQITFSRSGENSLQVLDNCVNVTFSDTNIGKDKFNMSLEETLTPEDVQVHSLKRCQAFNAIQEARSTEDLYIDDDLSAQMQENFGGKVKLIPLHGSLHEILCEKEDECCLIKVKQENGCDTIYFRCDNSDTESRDAIDGSDQPKDTVVYKRSISLVEERIQRIFPKEKKAQSPVTRRKKAAPPIRPKSEILMKNINKDTRVLSNSSPSLSTRDKEEVEVNIENVMSYQDSSSDECIKCQAENDDFELLERKIEEDLSNSLSPMACRCLGKISEENLSVLNDEEAG